MEIGQKVRGQKMGNEMRLMLFFVIVMIGQVAIADAPITALTVSPDGQQIVAGSQAGLSIYRMADRTKVRAIPTKLEHVHDVAFSPDGQMLLAVGGAPAEVGAAELFTWPALKLQQQWTIAEDVLTRAAWSSDSRWFATSGHDGVCRLTNLNEDSITIYKGHSRSVLALTVPTGDKQIISAGSDQTIQLWSLPGERQRTLNNHTGTVTDLAIKLSNNQPLLLSSSEDRTVRLWQPDIGRMIKFLRLASVPRRITWHPQGPIVTASDDGSVHVIDPDEMNILQTFQSNIHPIYELTTTGNGILVAGDGGIDFLEVPTQR